MLITLGIIGIIASLTLPSLIQKQQEKEIVARLKKTYSVLTNAYLSAQTEYSTIDNWDLIAKDSQEGAMNVLNKMAPYLKTSKICGFEKGCFPNTIYKYINGTTYGNENTSIIASRLRLADGTSISFWIYDPECSVKLGNEDYCVAIHVDANGNKGPNIYGHDMFILAMTKKGIFPLGLYDANQNEDEGASDGFTNCINKTGTGGACTAWVLFKENLDYLHCNNLSWEGKSKCN